MMRRGLGGERTGELSGAGFSLSAPQRYVGAAVGTAVGTAVGMAVGTAIGTVVGAGVGAGVGAAMAGKVVGAAVGTPLRREGWHSAHSVNFTATAQHANVRL